MQVVFRSLLAVTVAAWVASCTLDEQGLGSKDAGRTAAGAAGQAATGAAGAETAGVTGAAAGAAGTSVTGVAGDGAAGDGSTAGSTGTAGDGDDAAAGTTGAGGDVVAGEAGTSGAAGDTGVGGTGDAAGTNGSSGTTGSAGTTGAAGTTGSAGTGGVAPDPGCADGSREGYVDATAYPNIAACSGAWDQAGLTSPASKAPRCDRRAGNDGDKPDGNGCSVADLCAAGWHVCESAHAVSVATAGAGCADAIAATNGNKPIFFITRQRASSLICDTSAQPSGSNNLYGCGNIGSAASPSCSPFTKMLRDSDCAQNYPWTCADGGNLGSSTDELDIVTKQTSARGGVLCCHD